ncbi:Cytochrome P450 82A2 [Vitis vinifera]|uniref:Cytochrome P450 82A2 n=1 Tax=Vitis vinifera TaxID=29760 RepID=A0A438FEG2_VITVI|nr:Cytochrome P450 82A2 [Vitis vinifera]
MASLIGHLHLLGANKLLHQKLGDMADKYGPIFCIHLGFRKALVVSRWEVAKECYTTNDKKLTFSPPSTLELIRKVEQFLVCRPQKIN